MDEWTVDIISILHSTGLMSFLTEEERLAMGLDGSKKRWLLTVAMCCTTRCIVGMTLTPSAKGTAAVQTLEMIVSDKGKWADAVGALGSWDMHGTPEMIVTDCGPAFQSEEFRFACSDLGVTAQRAVAGFPELRGRIERVFQTIAQNLLPRLAGRTFGSIIEKGDANPEKRAALSVEDLIFAFVRWTVDVYHNLEHSGLDGETPLACWRRLNAEWRVRMQPDMQLRRLVFGSRLERTLDKEGIRVLNVLYHSERLATALNRKGTCRLDVRWHPSDIGAIEARLGNDWFTIPATESGFDGVPAQAWLATSRDLRATDPTRKAFTRKVIFQALEDISKRNAGAIVNAGLLVADWSPERIQREERRNLIGFVVSDTKKPKIHVGSVGQSIPDPDDHDPSFVSPTRKSPKQARNHKAGSTNWAIRGNE